MATYSINKRNPINQQIMLQALQNLSSLGSDYVKGQFALGREKELAQFKKDIELPDLEKSPMAVLGSRYDKIASELTQKETEALMSGNPDKLKEVKRAKNELKLLQDVLQERRQQEIEKRTKASLESELNTARLDKTRAETEFLTTARTSLAEAEGKRIDASTKEALARTKKLIADIMEKAPSAFAENYQDQLNKSADVTGSLEVSGRLVNDEKDIDLYLSLLPEVFKENERNRSFDKQAFVLRSLAGSPLLPKVLERLRARQSR